MHSTVRNLKSRRTLFSDPRWEEAFETLIRLTQRTEIIKRLLGPTFSHVRYETVKDAVTHRLHEMGIDVHRPRRKPTRNKFMVSRFSRYHGTVLYALTCSWAGPDASATTLTPLALLERLLATYHMYRSSLVPATEAPLLTFDDYIMLLDELAAGRAMVRECTTCASTFVWPEDVPAQTARLSCPVCQVHNHSPADASRNFFGVKAARRS